MRVRCIGLTAFGENAQNVTLHLHPDFHEVGIAHRINPERALDLPRQLRNQDVVEDGEKRSYARRRQRFQREKRDVEIKIVCRNACQLVKLGILRISFSNTDDCRDVAGNSSRQALADRLPMPLHEDEGHYGLKQHHRRDDDDQRSRIKPLWHAPGNPVRQLAERGRTV